MFDFSGKPCVGENSCCKNDSKCGLGQGNTWRDCCCLDDTISSEPSLTIRKSYPRMTFLQVIVTLMVTVYPASSVEITTVLMKSLPVLMQQMTVVMTLNCSVSNVDWHSIKLI